MAKRNSVRTSAKIATIASGILRNRKFSRAARKVAASALSNRRPRAR